MAELANPHDRFFKEVLSRPDTARDFLANYLPPSVVACLDVGSFLPTRDSFVDAELKLHLSDLLLRGCLRNGQGAYVYLLFEHKSFPDPAVAFQLLRYMVRIWERETSRPALGRLPPILPVVLYHGASRWETPAGFRHLVSCPDELAAFIPDFQHHLCDLSRYSDEEIRGAVGLRAALLVMKHVFDEDIAERLPALLRLCSELVASRTGLESLETLLRYLASATDAVDDRGLQQALESAFPEQGASLMPTLAEKWIEQGLQQGLQQGTRRGSLDKARESVLEILEVRFEVVPHAVAAAVRGLEDEAVLRGLHRKAATVASLDEFQELLRRALA